MGKADKSEVYRTIYVDYLRLDGKDWSMEQEQREVSEAEVVEMLRYLRKRAMWATVYAWSVYVLQLVLVFAVGVVVGKNW